MSKNNQSKTDMCENTYISQDLKKQYFLRLIKGYEKRGITKFFIEQYLHGSGNELVEKFWSQQSSSRMAFDLYSWIVNEPECLDFEFEYKLPTVKSGKSMNPANMDVYIRTKDTIYFIESKYLEQEKVISDAQKRLSGAYYQTLLADGTDTDISFDAPSHYYNLNKKLVGPQSLSDRFTGHDKVIVPYVEFCKEILKHAKSNNQRDWFDVKQELCHLLGIILFLIDSFQQKKLNGITTVRFSNIVYRKDESYDGPSEFAKDFIEKAQQMVSDVLRAYDIKNINFKYDTSTVQQLIAKCGDKPAYENDKKTLRETLEENYSGFNVEVQK